MVLKSLTKANMMTMIWNDLDYYDSYAWIENDETVTVFEDTTRPKRKVKAEFVDNGRNYKQQDWSLELLQRGMYLTNTESISSERDGEIYKSDVDVYVGVAAGLKSLIKGAVDNTTDFSYVHVDISPAALDYRKFVDEKIRENFLVDLDKVWEEYFSIDYTRPLPLYGGGYDSIERALDDYLSQVDIDRRQWYDFLERYAECSKTYIKLDLINNVKLLTKLIKTDKNVWFWYSNAFDWHQFRHSDKTYDAWVNYIKRNIPNVDLCGHTPPFTSSA
jgi:hypothetical protein